MKESAASALWTATKADVEERQRVAELMGPATFSQFLASAFLTADESAVSSELLAIGAEGIEVNTPDLVVVVVVKPCSVTEREHEHELNGTSSTDR